MILLSISLKLDELAIHHIIHPRNAGRQINGMRFKNRNLPFTTSWHMQPTIAATEELSAPPESGSKKPDAPLLLK